MSELLCNTSCSNAAIRCSPCLATLHCCGNGPSRPARPPAPRSIRWASACRRAARGSARAQSPSWRWLAKSHSCGERSCPPRLRLTDELDAKFKVASKNCFLYSIMEVIRRAARQRKTHKNDPPSQHLRWHGAGSQLPSGAANAIRDVAWTATRRPGAG